MARDNYDPAKAHQYYEEHKKLKGRLKRAQDQPPVRRHPVQQNKPAQAKVAQIEAKLNHLRELLRAKIADEKKSGTADKKPTQADKTKAAKESKHYRDTHQQQIKNLRKGKSTGGGSSPSSTKTAADMSASELRTAIQHTVVQLKQAIADARGG